MAVLEASVIPNLNDKVKLWKRFADDIYCLAESECISNVLFTLIFFHKCIKLTNEIEKDNSIPFVNILIRRKPRKVETTVYREKYMY